MVGVSYIDDSVAFDIEIPLVIVGAGAGGLAAGLAAKERGVEVVVLERDAVPSGSTAMSSGFVPAAGTRYQRALDIVDSAEVMEGDIRKKNKDGADAAVVRALCQASAGVIEWLADTHGVPFELVQGFLYPGHSAHRMHTTPGRSGTELLGYLMNASARSDLDVLTSARVSHLYIDADKRIRGISYARPDGSTDTVKCEALLLACNGFGGNSALVGRHIPAMKNAPYHGHTGNQGEALLWGELLGASSRDLGSFQGHGSLSWPQQVLVSWASMMEGGIQVNKLGARFSNEHVGYSEQARTVLAQPDGVAWNIFDERIHNDLLKSPDYRMTVEFGAVKNGGDIAALAEVTGLPADGLEGCISEMRRSAESGEPDRFGRSFKLDELLQAPFHAVLVTGALFHTQGGLEIDTSGRVLDVGGAAMPNLYAVGGAARGISGSSDYGYLSGNGLLSATVMGVIAGRHAADSILDAVKNESTGS